jgi:cytochrome c-type biogenesis protein CcmH
MLLRRGLLFLMLGLSALLLPWAARAAEAPDASNDPALEARVMKLSAVLRCLVCQNQSLADSEAPLALDLKQQVRDQLREGRSEDEVVAYLTERYGDFVLFRPPLKAATVLLWAGPALLLLIGLFLFWRNLRGAQAAPTAAPLEAADAERAARLLGEDGDAPKR